VVAQLPVCLIGLEACSGAQEWARQFSALANKLARICYATLRDQQPYAVARLSRKVERGAFALPA
jgi:hypothetical protein